MARSAWENENVRPVALPASGRCLSSSRSFFAYYITADTPVLEEKEDVLWLPPAALQTFQGRTFVIVEEPDGAQRRVDVTTDIEGDERVEIISGLEEGQTIVAP